MREKYVVLGGSGYIGQAFQAELIRRGSDYESFSRKTVDYTRYRNLLQILRESKPTFLINCAGHTGKPNVDACEAAKETTLLANAVLPETIANACETLNIPWGHVSSGCIYSGAKLAVPGTEERTEKDLLCPEVRSIWHAKPTLLMGYTEDDPPNFTFRSPPCSFYSGSKALGEEVLRHRANVFVWRLRIPFDHLDSPRNYLTKLMSYARLYDNVNSLSHRGDFAAACLELWNKRAEFGVYNLTNPGWVTTRQVVALVQQKLRLKRSFEFFGGDHEFYKTVLAPRSNAVLDSSKLRCVDIEMRPIQDALSDSLENWVSAS